MVLHERKVLFPLNKPDFRTRFFPRALELLALALKDPKKLILDKLKNTTLKNTKLETDIDIVESERLSLWGFGSLLHKERKLRSFHERHVERMNFAGKLTSSTSLHHNCMTWPNNAF